jgi:hypothetical protein
MPSADIKLSKEEVRRRLSFVFSRLLRHAKNDNPGVPPVPSENESGKLSPIQVLG